jgi:hypothetical protein
MKITAAIVFGIILVGMIAVTTIVSAGYIGATTDSNKGTPSPDTRNGMMGGGMMDDGMMGGYGYANCPYGAEYNQRYCNNSTYTETNGYVCPHMDSDDFGLNGTASPCMR